MNSLKCPYISDDKWNLKTLKDKSLSVIYMIFKTEKFLIWVANLTFLYPEFNHFTITKGIKPLKHKDLLSVREWEKEKL